MSGKLPIGQKGLLRGKRMAMAEEKQMTLKEAAFRLGISYRQAKLIKASYQKGGDAGLIHGNSGQRSNRKTGEGTRKLVIKAYQGWRGDFGPTFAAEEPLEVEGVKIAAETLRKWLLEEGHWERERKGRGSRSTSNPWMAWNCRR